MSEYRLKIGVFAPKGPVWPKISGKGNRPHQPFFFRMNDLLCGIRMCAQVSFVLSLSTRLTDRQTDRQSNDQKDIGNTLRCIKPVLHAVAR